MQSPIDELAYSLDGAVQVPPKRSLYRIFTQRRLSRACVNSGRTIHSNWTVITRTKIV